MLSWRLCSWNSFRNRAQEKQTHYSKQPLTPNPHIPHEHTSSASACIRIPHQPAEPHRNTNTHRTKYVMTHTHDIRIYSGNIIKNTLHTRELKNCRNCKKPQQPIFTETRLLKQSHTSRLITHYQTRTLMLKPLSLQRNTTHEINSQ